MSCDNISYDNRETCPIVHSSSCVAYTGNIADSIKALNILPECKPNINDIFKALQALIDKINTNLGDNKTLDKKCLTFDKLTINQKDLNQLFITELCAIKTLIGNSNTTVDPATIQIAVNLLCLQDPLCITATTYSLQTILTKLITAYCGLLTRVTTIETLLNI